MWDQDWHMMPHDWGWGGGIFMGVFWLLVIALIVFAIVYLVRQTGGRQFAGGPRGGPPPDRESPRDILDRRYAEGELSREEYEQMKKDLKE